jgi:hypothetical protein
MPNSLRPKKARRVPNKVKSMLISCVNEGNVHKESFPPRQTVNANFYCDVLRRLREKFRLKCPVK